MVLGARLDQIVQFLTDTTMAQQMSEELRRFVYDRNGWNSRESKPKATTGRLWLRGQVIAEGPFAHIGRRRSELIQQGYPKADLRITY